MFVRHGTRTLALAPAVVLVATLTAPVVSASASEPPERHHARVHTLTTFAPSCATVCGSGSTIGPDGALYVTDGVGGRVLRIDRWTGATSTFAHGLPGRATGVPIGGAMDVAFLGDTAYVLVTVVGPELGQPGVVDGIYRVNPDGTATAVTDIGAWAVAHPPQTDFFIKSGVQYAMQPYHDGFLVTDGHHNRILYASTDGFVREVAAFGDVVPTGLATVDRHVFFTEAGPVPHNPADGKVLVLGRHHRPTRVIASGAPLLVDVEPGSDGALYALAQGVWTLPPTEANAGMPASANTGSLVRVNDHGGFDTVATGIDRPTSMEIVGHKAYVVTLTGSVVTVRLPHCDY